MRLMRDRHCERSEAIQVPRQRLDCFVALLLAMTAKAWVSLRENWYKNSRDRRRNLGAHNRQKLLLKPGIALQPGVIAPRGVRQHEKARR